MFVDPVGQGQNRRRLDAQYLFSGFDHNDLQARG
jgi:hypothetical protein